MSDKKLLMILERSGENLSVNKTNDEYVLEGVFAQFGVENNNHRIYEEKEYLPHLDYLKKKITENRLLGELDHPDKFDISLSKVSHLIEDVKYDAKKRQIIGRIRLLDTPSGQIAKNLVDTGVPISISSRAAGVVGENKKVQIKRIFTYDLVADPGFENAQLSKVNESFGFDNHDDSIAIYDVTKEFPAFLESVDSEEIYNQTPEKSSKNMEQNGNFVSIEEMNKYSLVIKNEIEKINDRLSKISESSDKNEKVAKLEEELENIKKYASYLAESQNKALQYANYLAEKVGQGIAYAEHVAEKADRGIQYTEMIAEKMDGGFEYVKYVAGKVDENIRYGEYVAGKVNESIKYGNYLAEKMNQTIGYAEHIAEHADNAIRYGEYLAENAASKEDFKNLTEYAEYMFENMGAGALEGKTADVSEDKDDKGVLAGAVKESTVLGRYASLDNKIEAVLESVKKQKAEMKMQDSRYPFMQFLSESKKADFVALNETDKKRVANALNSKPAFDEEKIVEVWNSALTSLEVNEKWLTEMPVEYLPLWESASADNKDRITRQAKMFRLETAYQIKNFWQTRGLGKPAEETSGINESARAEAAKGVNSLGYSNEYLANISERLGKSFGK
jgi:Prohead core protein serine protease